MYTISDSQGHNARATEHTVPVVIDILKNDTDLDGDALTITSISRFPRGTTATLNTDNTVTFNPKGIVASYAFSYTISDGFGGTDTADVTIATSNPKGGHSNYPDIRNENITIRKNTAILIHVLENDTDADGDMLILDQVDSPSHRTIQKILGSVLYTPTTGYTGKDTFYYGVHDAYGHNGFGTVRISVD